MFVVPSLIRAGAETQVIDLVNQIDPGQMRVHLFTFERQLDLLEKLDRSKVSHHQCVRRSKYDLQPARELGRLIDELEIDVVHCTLQFALLCGWLARRYSRRQPRLIVSVHTTLNRDFKGDVLDWVMYQWLMRACDQIIFVCDAQRHHWIRRFPFIAATAVTIHNGINVARFDPSQTAPAGVALRAQLGIPADAVVLAHVAAFRPEKAHQVLLQALAQVMPELPELQVIFAGDGPLRSAITEQGRQLGLAPRLHFTGSLPDVRPVLAAADFSVLPSIAVETFSLAMLESLALEVPMIASDLGGAREAVLQGETGALVPPGQVAELAAALRALCRDAAGRRRMGQRGRQLVLERYDGAMMAQKTADAVLQCVRSAPGAARLPYAKSMGK
ncbi:glycosyltransferase family 4 protein [Duganella fentianensis]|nr:glycosyltransferase family 4 protein [Duganella fentianensis]